MNDDPSAVVIFCCGSHCPAEGILAELERNDISVIRLTECAEAFPNDSDVMADRILDVLASVPDGVPVGLAGSGVAGAGVMIAAAQQPGRVSAVVAINGRTDLAIDSLRFLRTPALLIVNEMPVLRMNREAVASLRGERRLEIVHGEGPEAVHHIVLKASGWLADRLTALVPA